MKRQILMNPKAPVLSARAMVSGMQSVDFSAESASPFAQLGYKPDSCKAYIEFEICHSLPAIAGPVQELRGPLFSRMDARVGGGERVGRGEAMAD